MSAPVATPCRLCRAMRRVWSVPAGWLEATTRAFKRQIDDAAKLGDAE